jgi:serine/threonine protein kinase
MNLTQKIKIVNQLLRAFCFIHYNGIVHRDIKSHNVLVDEYFNVKLCDFGLAKKVTELNLGSGKFCGTPAYMSPELFMKKSYDEKIDVFSFGTLLWEILVRKVPYDGLEVHEIKNKITTDEKLFVPKTIPLEYSSIIESCRHWDPSKRPSFSELLKLNSFKNN